MAELHEAANMKGLSQIGDQSSNYTNFDANGFITMIGNAKFKRAVREFPTTTAQGAVAPTKVFVGNYVGYQFAINDTAYSLLEIPNRWDEETNLSLEVDWCVNEAYATRNSKVQWQLDWSSVPENETEAINSPTHSGTLVTGDVNVPALAYGLKETPFTTLIPAASIGLNELMGLKLQRVALSGAGNNPLVNPIILQLELYTSFNKLGAVI